MVSLVKVVKNCENGRYETKANLRCKHEKYILDILSMLTRCWEGSVDGSMLSITLYVIYASNSYMHHAMPFTSNFLSSSELA